MSPPRSGMERIISPWEYRHPRTFAWLHIAGAAVLVGLAGVTFALGGANWTAYGFGLGFLALGLAHLAVGYWLLSIDRSSGGRR